MVTVAAGVTGPGEGGSLPAGCSNRGPLHKDHAKRFTKVAAETSLGGGFFREEKTWGSCSRCEEERCACAVARSRGWLRAPPGKCGGGGRRTSAALAYGLLESACYRVPGRRGRQV